MGKQERNIAKQQQQDSYGRAVSQGDQNMGYLQSQLPGATQQAQQTYGQASGAYTGMLGGMGAYDPGEYAKSSAQNDKNIATGGFNPDTLAKTQGDIQNVINTGGYTPDQMENLKTGGFDPTQLGVLRSGYGDLAKTGGISEDTADAMRRQTASGVQSVYSTMGQNLARKQAASGGGSASGETAEMARQMANAQGTAVTGVNANIGQLRQTGTIAGLGGLSGLESNVATGVRSGASDIAAGKRAGVGAEAGLATSQAQGTLSASAAQQDLATGAAQQKIAAAGGLTNLYNSTPGYVNSLVKSIIDQQQTTGQLTSSQESIMAELSKEPGLMDTIMKTIGQVSGMAAGVGGALP